MNNWVKINGPYGGYNLVLQQPDFHISYNPSPCVALAMFSSDEGQPETALCIGREYYILNGDFREKYENAINAGLGLKGCKAVFMIYEDEYKSSWSN